MANDLIAIEGLEELNLKLSKLERRIGAKVLRRALRTAVKPVLRQMKLAAPIGTKPHKTYNGLYVSSGHLKRSIKMGTRLNRATNKMSVYLGVKRSAFYGINFLDQGPHLVTSRRVRGKRSSNIFKIIGAGMENRRAKKIKPYTINQRPWFESVFRVNRYNMTNDFRRSLAIEIESAARGH